MINAAIVGLGWWGKNLVNSVNTPGSGTEASDAIRFSVGHSRHRDAAAPFCAEAGLTWVSDFESILADRAIDAVVLATPHRLHGTQILRAVAAGKHVFVEKPIALSVAEARTSIHAAEQAGLVLAVGFNRRFHPSMAMLRQEIQAGRFGTLVSISAEQTALHGLTLQPEAWRAQPEESPAGAMTAIGVHLVDGMIDLFGPIGEVYAQVARRASPAADDTTDIMVRFENGASCHIVCSTTATPNYRMAVYGTEAFAEIVGHPMETFRLVPASGSEQTQVTKNFNMLRQELEAFAASIESRRPFPTPLSQILHGVAVFEAVVRSVQTGQRERVAAERVAAERVAAT
jgi:predicted dehydrogenase